MCSPHFFNIIPILEDSFVNEIFNATFNNDYKFYKSSKDHRVADYICFTSNPQCALETSKHWESKCIEKFPWIKDYIKVTIVPHGFSISLCRKLSFLSGLNEVSKSGRKYGYNSLYRGKGYTLSIVKMKSPGCLTGLRLEIVFEVTTNILKACGGIPYHEADCTKHLQIYVTNKTISRDDSVVILVGPVNTQISGSKSIIDSVHYKSYRMNEITTMCEHKSDISDNIENKSKLLKSIIYFDLLQCNIWRSVTLHLLNKNSGENTSCKGSLFVMYNYARLHTLCEQFDDKVSSGIYSPLPPLEEIDFATLDKDEEWKIMFHCILCWPSILSKSIIDLENGRPKIHLIFEFLKTISNNFSQYYHRIRIFTEPRSHLMPVLFARMHLLKALLIVFEIALKLVGISPLNKM